MREETNWYRELEKAFNKTKDDFDKMETTLTEKQSHEMFDPGYGGHRGEAFTAWGEKYVYFPVVYDGLEWVGFAPRNPCDIATEHWGGE